MEMKISICPKGWLETFWEVSQFIHSRLEKIGCENSKFGWYFGDNISEVYDDLGTPGLIDLAIEWTIEFEMIHHTTNFDLTGDYWYYVFEFCKYKNQENG
jgi:hypothetical protein